jgi:type II secretory pathway pseudopilin PulG
MDVGLANQPDDRGETLLELVISLMIMSIAVVAIIGGIGTSIKMSDIHRKQATAGAAVRSYAEAVKNYVAAGNYVSCATPTSTPKNYLPATVGFTPPSGPAGTYIATFATAQTWSGYAWAPCSADNAYQKITLSVASPDGSAVERLDVVLRLPCSTTPLDARCT